MQQYFGTISNNARLQKYSVFKTVFCFEEYLKVVNPKNRITMSKLRCSSHKLMIEQSRHLNIDKENRICQNCNMNIIEDEYHFLLACPDYRHLCIQYLSKYYYTSLSIRKFKQQM